MMWAIAGLALIVLLGVPIVAVLELVGAEASGSKTQTSAPASRVEAIAEALADAGYACELGYVSDDPGASEADCSRTPYRDVTIYVVHDQAAKEGLIAQIKNSYWKLPLGAVAVVGDDWIIDCNVVNACFEAARKMSSQIVTI
ncbi:hypothetical protein [Streptosporangium sp. NPDC049644]|uniref:hypothetical protein n=1 Tax=Streptosporangium sp. NPDC049644 TaxID=3155507 RepID=UPI0034230F43